MASHFVVEQFQEYMEHDWDVFIESASLNGTFLQTRNFLNYHPVGRFEDCSLVFKKGDSIVAVLPAALDYDESKKVLYSHGGTTFGGLIVDKRIVPIEKAIEIVDLLNKWAKDNGFSKVVLKQTSDFFSTECMASIEYALQYRGYVPYGELSFVVNLEGIEEPVESAFKASKRRDCRYAQKAGCKFKELHEDSEVAAFYEILEKSLMKFETKPVHTFEELLEFKNSRLSKGVRFFGVFIEDKMIAGSMVFQFGKQVFHTQYLAADPAHLDLFPMNYLDWNLIRIAKEEGFPKFSFGVSTEDHGREINISLAKFKEGFGCEHSMNWTFTKEFSNGE